MRLLELSSWPCVPQSGAEELRAFIDHHIEWNIIGGERRWTFEFENSSWNMIIHVKYDDKAMNVLAKTPLAVSVHACDESELRVHVYCSQFSRNPPYRKRLAFSERSWRDTVKKTRGECLQSLVHLQFKKCQYSAFVHFEACSWTEKAVETRCVDHLLTFDSWSWQFAEEFKSVPKVSTDQRCRAANVGSSARAR